MTLSFAAETAAALPLHVVTSESFDDWHQTQEGATRNWIDAMGFSAKAGEALMLPDAEGRPVAAVAGCGSQDRRARMRFVLAAAVPKLAPGTYRIASASPGIDLTNEALGWLFEGYSFDRYKTQGKALRQLVAPEGVDVSKVETLAAAEGLTRDLVNTPAADMGPQALEEAARELASAFGATVEIIAGEALLDQNFPMIHAVGRAADQAPRLIDMHWGTEGPKLTLVGKGVCFDTGGLNLKPGASMGLMKKDMGGAANTLGLARMIMGLGLKVRLRVLIPAVENAVSGNSFRPQDILTARNGLTVEINNTDAEGRLVLADALALAAEDTPDLMISLATLTGAARVAVGPDLAPYFTDDDAFSRALEAAAPGMADPVWRLPLHAPYETMIEPGIADLDNAPKGGMAGATTAALFLRRFAGHTRYAHFDIYSWQPTAAPGRSKGGFGQGARAILGALPEALGI